MKRVTYDVICHCDEQVEEPASRCQISPDPAYIRKKNACMHAASTHSNPPASISICMVPLRLNVALLRIIKAR